MKAILDFGFWILDRPGIRSPQRGEAAACESKIRNPKSKIAPSLVSLAAAATLSSSVLADNPTFSHDVQPILREHCVSCHREGGRGPFPLETYEQVQKRAQQIRIVTNSGFMPPWLPDDLDAKSMPKIKGGHRLSLMQLSDVQKWIDQGCKEGDAKAAIAAAASMPANLEWPLGAPDLVLSLPEPYVIPQSGLDVVRTFVYHVEMPEDRFAEAIDISVEDAKLAHHASLLIDTTGSAKMLDDAEAGPGYPSMGDIGFNLAGCAGGWSPGRPVMKLPATVGRYIPKKCDIVVEMHFSPTGKPEKAQPRVGLYFNGEKVDHLVTCVAIGSNAIDIPAGEKRHVITDSIFIPVDVELRSLMPHARYVCQGVRVRTHELFDPKRGRTRDRTILNIPDWDYNFMQEFVFEKPIRLAAGARITVEFTYDNSEGNPQNPNHPPKAVHRGGEPTDESALLIMQLVAKDPGDIKKLEEAHRAKQEERMKATPPPTTKPKTP